LYEVSKKSNKSSVGDATIIDDCDETSSEDLRKYQTLPTVKDLTKSGTDWGSNYHEPFRSRNKFMWWRAWHILTQSKSLVMGMYQFGALLNFLINYVKTLI
jgi:hypothetical protein